MKSHVHGTGYQLNPVRETVDFEKYRMYTPFRRHKKLHNSVKNLPTQLSKIQ